MRLSIRGFQAVRLAAAVALVAMTCAAGAARQAPELGSLRARFPASSIDSTQRADEALAATDGAKGTVEKDFKAEAQACAKTFLVNDCLDRARDRQRKRLDEINAVELEANRVKRKDKAERLETDRARREAERASGKAADDAQRARNRAKDENRQSRVGRDEAAKSASDERRQPGAKHAPAPVNDDAATRAKNAAAHATKVAEAKAHRAEIARRVAANAADRKRRADEKAAREAKAPVPPARS